jgi:ribosomal protein S18 acetylase RimI-like enzyme
MTAAERADGVDEETTAADVLDGWRRLDPTRDAWVVERADGSLAGYADATIIADGRYRADGYVDPAGRGRGIGATLLGLAEARALELAGGRPVQLYNAVPASNDAAASLLEGSGYTLARRFFRMAIALDGPPPAPALPDGIAVRTLDPDRDGPAVHAALEECFADHWDPVFVPYEQFRTVHFKGDGFDPGLWVLAVAGDEIAGVAACRIRYGRGFVDELGVRRPWRGLGLGLALLQLAFATFWARGQRSVALSVDTNSLTGATRLYERAGMDAEFEVGIYRKELG